MVSDNGGGKDCRNKSCNDSKDKGHAEFADFRCRPRFISASTKKNQNQNIERKHFGLENIKERAKRMNGEAQINFSNEDGGTTVAVTIKDSVR